LKYCKRKSSKKFRDYHAANTGVYVLLGAVPVEMVIERNMLTTFMNIARNKLSVEYHILSR
jgi:hypothetical protein